MKCVTCSQEGSFMLHQKRKTKRWSCTVDCARKTMRTDTIYLMLNSCTTPYATGVAAISFDTQLFRCRPQCSSHHGKQWLQIMVSFSVSLDQWNVVDFTLYCDFTSKLVTSPTEWVHHLLPHRFPLGCQPPHPPKDTRMPKLYQSKLQRIFKKCYNGRQDQNLKQGGGFPQCKEGNYNLIYMALRNSNQQRISFSGDGEIMCTSRMTAKFYGHCAFD